MVRASHCEESGCWSLLQAGSAFLCLHTSNAYRIALMTSNMWSDLSQPYFTQQSSTRDR